MSKKTATIIIVIAVILIFGALLYFYFNYAQTPTANPNGTGQNTNVIFPTGPSGNGVGGTPVTPPTQPTGANGFVPILRQITTVPTVGAAAFGGTGSTTVRYVDRGTGNTYEASLDTTNSINRLSNTTIPKIYEAIWNANGSALVLRYPKEETEDIESYYAILRPGAAGQSEGTLEGNFLTENMKNAVPSPRHDKLFYLLTFSQSATGIITNFDGTKKTQVFLSPLRDWLAAWPTQNIITVTSKPSAAAPGLMYYINSVSGAVTKILSDIPGLTTLTSPDGTLILYSVSDGSGISLKFFSVNDSKLTEVGVKTLPEKCVWGSTKPYALYCAVPETLPDGAYPDSWYQGLVSLSDSVWKIDPSSGEGALLVNLKDYSHQDIDVENPIVSQNDRYFLFINKKDLTLWSVRLGQ